MAKAQGTRNTVMFVVGLAMALLVGGLMFFTDLDSGPLAALGVIAIVFIAASGVRPFGG